MIAIDVRALKKSYGAVHALRGIDLSIAATGQIIGLLGPNGAGKTTFVEILEGLRTATSGSVSVLGLDPATRVRRAARAARRAAADDGVHAGPHRHRNVEAVWRALSHAGYGGASGFSRIVPMLERVDLVDKAKAMVRGLSGGQKQRLALAMAMLHDPDLYILDEPTSGLDPIARRQIHDILLTLKRDGKTVLLSSHYLDEIEALADRVIILAAGEIVADGTPLDLLARAAGASTLWLDVSGAIDPSQLVPQATFEGRDGSLFRYRTADPTAAIVGLADSLRASGARLADLRLKRPSLEDVYLQLVGVA